MKNKVTNLSRFCGLQMFLNDCFQDCWTFVR